MSQSARINALALRVGQEIKAMRAEGGGSGGLPARQSAAYATASLEDEAEATGTITLAKSYRLLSIATDRPCRVRLYATAAQCTADAARAVGTDPVGDHGLMLEFVSTASVLRATLSPTVDGTNLETTPTPTASIAVRNLSGTASTVAVSFVFLGTE